MKKYFLIASIIITGLILVPVKAQAQFYSSYAYMNNAYLNYALASQRAAATRKGLRANSGNFERSPAATPSRRTTSGTTNAPVKNVPRGTTTFSSSGSLIIPAEFARQFGKTAEEKRDAETAFTKGFGIFEDTRKRNGYGANDVARASSMLFINCLHSYSDKPLTPKQKDGIYRTFKNLYETDEYFQSLADTERQKSYETQGLLWAFLATISIAAQEKGDLDSLQKSRDTAAYIFEHFVGVPITGVRLKTDGFEID